MPETHRPLQIPGYSKERCAEHNSSVKCKGTSLGLLVGSGLLRYPNGSFTWPSLSPFFALHGQQPRYSGLLFEPSGYDFCRKIHIFRVNAIYCQTFCFIFYVKNIVHLRM